MLTKDQIKSEAMQLGAAEREALAEELLLSLSENDCEEIDAAWLTESKRRYDAFRAGSTKASSVEDAIERILNKGRQ